jgi:hypothetical protein
MKSDLTLSISRGHQSIRMKGDSNLSTNIPTSATREGPDFDVIHGYLEQVSEKVIWFARSYNMVPDDESRLCLLTWLDLATNIS